MTIVMDPIKEAFIKIKEDMQTLKDEIISLNQRVEVLSAQTTPISTSSNNFQQTDQQTQNQTNELKNMALEGSYPPKNSFSTGNRGVPTDRQTNQQTDQQIKNSLELPPRGPISEFKKANEILSQLDDVKKGIRNTFKSLTAQEMRVFATLYQLESQGDFEITYRKVASILDLSESSIRDYINKILQKGVIIDKIRQNNKTIHLKVSENITNLASLETIERLRQI